MNSENVWIPWNERTDLNDWVLFMGGVREIYIYLGCISPEYLAEFEHCFAINYQKYIKPSIGSKKCCFSLFPFDVYPSDIQDKILLEYHLYKENLLQKSNDLLFKIYKYWYKQRELFEGLDKVRFERNCHSLFKNDSALVTNDCSDSPAVPASVPADKDSPADKTAKLKSAREKKNCRITIDIGLKVLDRRRKGERQKVIAKAIGFNHTQFQKNKILRAAEGLAKQEKNETKDWQTLALAAGLYDDTTDIDYETFSDVPISQKPFRK
ncbi:MAG: hypothetical protein IJF84_03190 [Thermoguttaceae bacterium]|nr:hypothetical protein [Thermoguttaceae bacterium]